MQSTFLTATFFCNTNINIILTLHWYSVWHIRLRFSNQQFLYISCVPRVPHSQSQQCTNSWRQVTLETKFCSLAHNICEFSKWNFLHVSLPGGTYNFYFTSRLLEICAPLLNTFIDLSLLFLIIFCNQ